MREVALASVSLVKFGRYDGQKGRPNKQFYELGAEAIFKTLDAADMEWKHIQAAFCGSVYQGTGSGHQAIKCVGLTGIPIVNVENACSSSASALRLAYQAVANEVHDIVLVLGMEKLPLGLLETSAFPLWQRYMGLNVQPAHYGMKTVRYMEDYGVTLEDIARVTVLSRRNGALNPNAMFQQEVTLEEVLSSRVIASPLRLLMVCANADGAAAAIVCTKDKLKSQSKVVTIAASIHTTGTYGTTEEGGGSVKIKNLNCTEISAKQAWEVSGYGPEDIDVVQGYDTMATALMWNIEDLGFCGKGEFAPLLKEGVFDINGKIGDVVPMQEVITYLDGLK